MKTDRERCETNCCGRIVNKEKGIYCHHIESKMPKGSKQSIKAIYSDRIEDYWLREQFEQRPLHPDEVELKLKRFGLDKYEVELLMLRYVENKPMKDIVKEQGWVNMNSATHYLRSSLRKLRDGGFKFHDKA